MPTHDKENTAAESLGAAMQKVGEAADRTQGLGEIRDNYSNVIHGIMEEEGITAELRDFIDALGELYEGADVPAISLETRKASWEHEAGNNKKLRDFLRTAQTVFVAAKELRNFDKEKGDRETEFLGQWAEKAQEKLHIDEKALEVLKKIFLSDQPNFAELGNVLDKSRATIYAKILPLEHTRFRAKVAKERGKVSTEEEKLKVKEAKEDVLLEASIGHILNEEENAKFGEYNTPEQADALYQALQDKGLLQQGSVVLLKIGGGNVYVSWETNANTAKANLRKMLASMQNDYTGPINHVQTWRKQREYYNELPGGTIFRAVSTVDGEILVLKKNKNGDLAAKSVGILKTKESERSKDATPSSQDILANLDHYIVNIDPQNVEEETE